MSFVFLLPVSDFFISKPGLERSSGDQTSLRWWLPHIRRSNMTRKRYAISPWACVKSTFGRHWLQAAMRATDVAF
jgi:hypothetical protein